MPWQGRGRRLGVVWALVLLAAPVAAVAQSIEVTPLARDGQVMVSFEVREAFGDDVLASIQSGLPTSFTYDVDLRRSSLTWVDRTIATARVSVMVRYDNLTRRYQITLIQDGRVDETRVTEEVDEVRRMATEFTRLPLFSTRGLEANAEYYIRVRARNRPRNNLFVLPWDRSGALGSAKFTFLP